MTLVLRNLTLDYWICPPAENAAMEHAPGSLEPRPTVGHAALEHPPGSRQPRLAENAILKNAFASLEHDPGSLRSPPLTEKSIQPLVPGA